MTDASRNYSSRCNSANPPFSPTSTAATMLSGGLSIPVYDDGPDGNIAAPAKSRLVQPRRKRKKLVGFPGKHEFLRRRMLGKLFKWWPLLLFLPAIGLLVLEWSRILGVSRQMGRPKHDFSEKEVQGNLNRLDPTTRMVNGTRQRCLKLLPPEELQYLDLPLPGHSSFPVKRVAYRSETDRLSIIGNTTVLQPHSGTTKFNLFTGYQTLEEREQSYKVNETAVVHCGFYSENGGFKVSDEDENFMRSCEVVVSTCAFGGGDDLYQPIGMSEASPKKVCFVAFWDEITLAAQQLEGHPIDEDHMIGKWRIVVVRELPFLDQRLNGKIPKMLGHRLFPRARYSIWVDSKSQFRRDPLGVLEALLWRTNSELAISEHGARSSVYDEGKAVVKKNKATPEEVEVQLSQYRQDGFPDEKRFNGKKALSEASVIVREHTPMTNLFMCLWFNEVVRFTSRDQLSFPYVLRQLAVLKNINMFPVCTRKDLVNSMGHRRKVKPLKS
ncbi:probable hexosyltransferase MUCI70 [Malania oleifera]|uniref:probable hexosyltransferase MUCI70 n=1 Tax=Malania oleifera TaxID=397392 RepID=UPI0025AE5E6B|nr:probable hexosyltransferase MUCI70 [Malania oleifera]